MEETVKQIESKRHVGLKRLLIFLGILVAAGVVLVAYGGGSSQSTTETATTVSQTDEVINGITVPPEPDPTINNSTLAGIDVNKNGVRDDVERMIATRWPENFSNGMTVARHTQLLLTQRGSTIDPALEQAAFCNVALRRVDGGILILAILNTEDRQGAYQDNVGIVKTHGCN